MLKAGNVLCIHVAGVQRCTHVSRATAKEKPEDDEKQNHAQSPLYELRINCHLKNTDIIFPEGALKTLATYILYCQMDIELKSDKPGTIELSADEKALFDEINVQAPPEKVVKVSKRPMFSRPSPSFMQAPGVMRMTNEDSMDGLFNPGKSDLPPVMEDENVWDGGEGPQYAEMPQAQMPSEGYKTIEDEKADLLNKLARLQKKGFNVSGRLNNYSNIDEIRTEYKRVTYQIEVDQSIRFQRRMLMAFVTGLEFLNKRYDPFDVQLDGWSDDMMRNMDDYDNVFEDLHNKYKTKMAIAPEVKLIMMVGGSAMMFHLTNSMFKSSLPNVNQVMKENPELMKSVMEAMVKSQNGGGAPPAEPQGERPPSPRDASGRREMKGPGFDLGGLMTGFMAPPQPSIRPVIKKPARDEDELSDIVTGQDEDVKDIPINSSDKKTKGKSKKKEVVMTL